MCLWRLGPLRAAGHLPQSTLARSSLDSELPIHESELERDGDRDANHGAVAPSQNIHYFGIMRERVASPSFVFGYSPSPVRVGIVKTGV